MCKKFGIKCHFQIITCLNILNVYVKKYHFFSLSVLKTDFFVGIDGGKRGMQCKTNAPF